MNKGGFSWKRAAGLTKAKQKLSKKSGIPLTKSGRQRKMGKALSGGGCLLYVLTFIIASLALIILLV